MAYSPDGTHIATAQKGRGAITVLDCVSGALEQSINSHMQIQDIKISHSTIFVMDKHELISWDLKPGGVVLNPYDASMAIVDTLTMGKSTGSNTGTEHVVLSHDCSQVAFVKDGWLFLYDIKTKRAIYGHDKNTQIKSIQFSPDGHQLWVLGWDNGSLILEVVEDQTLKRVPKGVLKDEWPWVDLFSCEYHVEMGSGWVVDPKGSKVLWIPPSWRAKHWQNVKWDGNFLAILDGYHRVPVIIEFLEL